MTPKFVARQALPDEATLFRYSRNSRTSIATTSHPSRTTNVSRIVCRGDPYMNGQGRFKLNRHVFFALFCSFSLFFDIFRSFSNLFAHFLTKLLVTCESPYRFRSFSDQSSVTLCLLVFVCVAEPYNYLIFSVLFCLNESIFIATNSPWM